MTIKDSFRGTATTYNDRYKGIINKLSLESIQKKEGPLYTSYPNTRSTTNKEREIDNPNNPNNTNETHLIWNRWRDISVIGHALDIITNNTSFSNTLINWTTENITVLYSIEKEENELMELTGETSLFYFKKPYSTTAFPSPEKISFSDEAKENFSTIQAPKMISLDFEEE